MNDHIMWLMGNTVCRLFGCRWQWKAIGPRRCRRCGVYQFETVKS